MKQKHLKIISRVVLIIILFTNTVFASTYMAQLKPVDPFVVVLDAGHGGNDPGNLGNGFLEKNIALNIVLKVGAYLKQYPNIKVIYTRDDDTFVDLFKRGEIANKANADLFVSVHCDSHTSQAHGAGTFVLGLHANKQNFEIAKKENSAIYMEDNYETTYANYDINSPESVIGLTIMQEEFLDQSILLAKLMQDNFSGRLKRNDRKVKQAGFIVLHQTFMPSVLVETGFLTNKNEGTYLNSIKGQAEMGKAISDAIVKYKENITGKTATKVSATKPNINEEKVAEKSTEKVKDVVLETPKALGVKKAETKDLGVVYKVQLFASGKDIALTSTNFNGLNTLSREPVKALFRYMYGVAMDYKAATVMKAEAQAKGYPNAYVVAYKDNVRISVEAAKAMLNE